MRYLLTVNLIFLSRDYTKMTAVELDALIGDIQADAEWMRVLHILGEQFVLLINKGKPDLDIFLGSLKAEALISEDEYEELKTAFAVKPLMVS
jgi:hypothetical protein